MRWNNPIKFFIWTTIIQQCLGVCENITKDKDPNDDDFFLIKVCDNCTIYTHKVDKVLAKNCSYADFASLHGKASRNSTFQFSNQDLTLQYDENMCYDIEVQRNLKTLFPDLKNLTISLHNDHNSSCPLYDMTDCPKSLTDVTLNNLKDKVLPRICQPQITYLNCHSCDNLKDISSVSDMEKLETLKIAEANLTELEGNLFEKNKNLKRLDLQKCSIKKVYNNSLNGLANLEEIVLHGNPMNIPSGFFEPAVNLQTIQWTDDHCFEHGRTIRTWPNNMLSSANTKLKKFTYKALNPSCVFHLNAKAFSSSQYDSIEDLDLKHTKLDSSVFEDFVFNFKNLKTLDLTNNRLEEIGKLTNYLPNLTSLIIRGNNVSCECATIQNLRYLHKVGKIQGNDFKFMGTGCFNDTKTFQDKVDECGLIRNVAIICSSIFGALLFVSLCFIGWFYRCHIKHLYEKVMTVLYHHKLFNKMFCKEDQHFLYDVLLLCHDESLDLIQTIYEKIQNINSGYNVGFKLKDFRTGYDKQEENFRLMNNSQCIIIILSKTYLKTHKCCEELINANKDFYKRLILIHLEDMQELLNERKDDQGQELMNDRTDDQTLKIHKILKNLPSLKYDENPKAFFWKFLEYKMPHIELSNSVTMQGQLQLSLNNVN